VVVGFHLGDEEIVCEIGWPKVMQVDPAAPGRIENNPCSPY
jgi:hypothetical protein